MAGHKLSLADALQEIVETLVTLESAKLHELRGFMGKSNGHLFLLATGIRIIRMPDREAELRFRMPSVSLPTPTGRRSEGTCPDAILPLGFEGR
jgi:hypothetical protein